VIIPFLNLCKFAAGGKQGNGRQFLTWVHMADVAGMIEWIVDNNKEGIYNCAAPNAVTNKEFMKTLRKVTGHFVGLPTPSVLLEFGTWIIGSESELILKSRRVYPARAISEGYSFKYAELETALRNVIDALPRKRYHLV
jgi:NAD dependent epimerase/dehydratase family enzyme